MGENELPTSTINTKTRKKKNHNGNNNNNNRRSKIHAFNQLFESERESGWKQTNSSITDIDQKRRRRRRTTTTTSPGEVIFVHSFNRSIVGKIEIDRKREWAPQLV